MTNLPFSYEEFEAMREQLISEVKDTATKASLISKHLKAAWNKDYLISLL